MSTTRNKHHRRSIRLPGYDYASSGAYFVTICVRGGECLLGTVVDGEMQLNEYGQIAAESWEWLADQYSYVSLDAWVIMPNHMHGIIVIEDDAAPGVVGPDGCGGGSRTAPTNGLPTAPTNGLPTAPTNGLPTAPTDGLPTAPTDGLPTAPTNGLPTAPTDGMPEKRKALGRLVGAFKTASTKRINQLRQVPGVPFWQRNYWEYMIRNEASLDRIREYIETNPVRWAEDQLHPDAPPNPFNQGSPRQGQGEPAPAGAMSVPAHNLMGRK
jgi:putative transposase